MDKFIGYENLTSTACEEQEEKKKSLIEEIKYLLKKILWTKNKEKKEKNK